MGIKNLNKFLRNNCPSVYNTIHLSDYAFKKVAVDLSLFLFKFKAICGNRWVSAFINLIVSLRRNDIHCVFIYDSGAPIDKTVEREERAANRENIQAKIFTLEQDLEHYYNTNEILPSLTKVYDKIMEKQKRLLSNRKSIDVKVIEQRVEQLKSQVLHITQEDFLITKTLFDILKIPYFDAPLEAETMCADLCKRGLVDAVLSDDTDIIAYGTPLCLSKINTGNDTCTEIRYDSVLEMLDVDKDSFLDFCIMCGTDYNKNIPRYGPEKNYKMITQYKNIDELGKIIDVSILNHNRVREIFTEYEMSAIDNIPYCGFPDFDKLQEFVQTNNILNINIEKIKSAFIRKIIYEK